MTSTMTVPELGENVDSVEVVKVLVAVGDRVAVDQPVIEVETEKASVEIPADTAGVVTEIHVAPGDSLTAGAAIATIQESDEAVAPADPVPPPAAIESASKSNVEVPQSDRTAARDREEAATGQQRSEVIVVPEPDQPVSASAAGERLLAPRWAAPEGSRRLVPAAPTVRRFAREVGVDINQVRGSGPGGRISIDDVKAFAAQILRQAATSPLGVAGPDLPDLTGWGEVRREPMSKIRQATARNLARAWVTVPQVTHHDEADITGLEALRKAFRGRVEAAGGKLTITAILVRIVASALRVFPKLNAAVDVARQEVVFRQSVHIGVAVDTERGLLVPVIRDADRKNITTISAELDDLARSARDRKLKPEDMQGAGFTISNLGGIGGTGFTPIVNWPEVAILGVSRAATHPRWIDGGFVPRLILPLSLSYDHRLVDGADAARFLRWVAEAVEEPLLLALEG